MKQGDFHGHYVHEDHLIYRDLNVDIQGEKTLILRSSQKCVYQSYKVIDNKELIVASIILTTD
jgi:hypothetical protein